MKRPIHLETTADERAKLEADCRKGWAKQPVYGRVLRLLRDFERLLAAVGAPPDPDTTAQAHVEGRER